MSAAAMADSHISYLQSCDANQKNRFTNTVKMKIAQNCNKFLLGKNIIFSIKPNQKNGHCATMWKYAKRRNGTMEKQRRKEKK